MVSFWIGVLLGAIASPLILAAISKPLMNLFLKRQSTKLTKDVMGKMDDLGAKFNELNLKKEEKDGIIKIRKEEED